MTVTKRTVALRLTQADLLPRAARLMVFLYFGTSTDSWAAGNRPSSFARVPSSYDVFNAENSHQFMLTPTNTDKISLGHFNGFGKDWRISTQITSGQGLSYDHIMDFSLLDGSFAVMTAGGECQLHQLTFLHQSRLCLKLTTSHTVLSNRRHLSSSSQPAPVSTSFTSLYHIPFLLHASAKRAAISMF